MSGLRLEAAWHEAAARARIARPAAETIFRDLRSRYTEPGRAYHTLEHIAAMLDIVSRFADRLNDELAVTLAVWFHDAVYDTRARDNEERSAAYAVAALTEAGVSASLIGAAERLILATKTHQAAPEDWDAHLLLDADLAVLGAVSEDYDRYARAIRQEYAWVPEEDYRAGRRAVLESFLKREHLYQTPFCSQLWEQAARENLRREIASL